MLLLDRGKPSPLEIRSKTHRAPSVPLLPSEFGQWPADMRRSCPCGSVLPIDREKQYPSLRVYSRKSYLSFRRSVEEPRPFLRSFTAFPGNGPASTTKPALPGMQYATARAYRRTLARCLLPAARQCVDLGAHAAECRTRVSFVPHDVPLPMRI